jgi:tetrahydromethanopterin S-methyltransferase subunit B
MTENLQANLDEIIKRLSNIEETLDGLAEKFDTEIEQVRREIDLATQAATNAPNRTGTILETNQQTIFKVVCQIRDQCTKLGAAVEELQENAET